MSSATALTHSDLNSGLQFFSKPKITVKKRKSHFLVVNENGKELFLCEGR
jgi:hypothetical protein